MVIPCVKFQIAGVELTAQMSVAADGGIERSCDVLLSMADIRQLVDGGVRFEPHNRE